MISMKINTKMNEKKWLKRTRMAKATDWEKKLLVIKPETNSLLIWHWDTFLLVKLNFLHSFILFIFLSYIYNVGYGRREVVELLLANGASIQACDEGKNKTHKNPKNKIRKHILVIFGSLLIEIIFGFIFVIRRITCPA